MSQPSTGPKTEAGKFEASKNALTHGLTAVNIERFPAAIRESYSVFLAAQIKEWQPFTLNERIYVERYAFDQFQLLRSQSLLAHAVDELLADSANEALRKRHLTLSRHFRSLERSVQQSLAELRRMIADRIRELEICPEEEGAGDPEKPAPPLFLLTPHHLLSNASPPAASDPLRFANSPSPAARAYYQTYGEPTK